MSYATDNRRSEIQKMCRESLNVCPINESDDQNGLDFYKFFFTNYPNLRVYFKGAENYTAEDVQKSDRFRKQGHRILLAMHLVAKTYEEPMIFHAYIREIVNRHRQFKLEPSLWVAFWTVFLGYLESKNSAINQKLDQQTKDAWIELGQEFATIARQHLKNCALPY